MSHEASGISSHQSGGLDPNLQSLINEIELPENQGIPLTTRDYVVLFIVTLAVPVALTIWGVLNA